MHVPPVQNLRSNLSHVELVSEGQASPVYSATSTTTTTTTTKIESQAAGLGFKYRLLEYLVFDTHYCWAQESTFKNHKVVMGWVMFAARKYIIEEENSCKYSWLMCKCRVV